jgi:hypothetical protein
MITEVRYTEGGVETILSPYVPSNTELSPWLEKILQDLLFAPHSERIITVSGISWHIDRANVTSITVTRVHNG